MLADWVIDLSYDSITLPSGIEVGKLLSHFRVFQRPAPLYNATFRSLLFVRNVVLEEEKIVSEQVNDKSNSPSRHTSSKSRRNVKNPLEQEKSLSTITKGLNRWRSGWEIDLERQQYLNQCRSITPDLEKGTYPFQEVEPKLTAADVGWLLETHDNGHGPVDLNELHLQVPLGLDLRGADLQRANLRRYPLAFMLGGLNWDEQRKFDSAQAEKASVLLERAFLEEADLTGAILYRAHLENAYLSRSNLTGAYLEEVKLQGATLTQARLNGAVLTKANLEEANLRGAYLEPSNQGQPTLLFEANLNEADLQEAYMKQAGLYGAFLQRANLRGAHLEEADLNGAHLEGAHLQEAHLTGAQLHHAHLEGADFTGASLEGADLSDAYLEGAIFTNADLTGAILQRARMEGADCQGANLRKGNVRQVCFAGSNLCETHFEEADLRDTHLEGKVMEAADLERIQQWAKKFSGTMQPANLQGAFFDAGTDFKGITLSDQNFGCVTVADVHWGDANLSVIEWAQIKVVGDERKAMLWQNHPKRANFAPIVIEDNQLAIRTYRQLAVILQSHGLNEEASRFSYRSQMLHRRVLWMELGLWKSIQRMKIWMQQSWVWNRVIVLQPRVQQSWVWQRVVVNIGQWLRKLGSKVKQLGNVLFSIFLGLLAGYGYKPGRALAWYVLVIFGFTTAYSLFGHIPFLPDALVFSTMSFHGRGFFPSLSNETNLHNPLVALAAAEAVIGLFIEISFIATFTKRFFGS